MRDKIDQLIDELLKSPPKEKEIEEINEMFKGEIQTFSPLLVSAHRLNKSLNGKRNV